MPAPTNRNQRDKKGINVTPTRGFFLSSHQTKSEKTSHLHPSSLTKNAIEKPHPHADQFDSAIDHTPSSLASTLPRVAPQGVREYMKSGTFLLAEDAAGLAGCVYIEMHGERSYLGLLSVEPKRQGCGLGRKLMAEAENFARDAGCRAMDLRAISPRAEQLLPFYLRLGYHA